ncbi:MAG: ATP-binding protein [Candidatus Pacebacteria bacterium]|nr:ATP-binding protein [Candidatus Paceibacterota bacterium]MDD5012845.1 ATP-binding protein [Candidatus Paceibacterota bacterium]
MENLNQEIEKKEKELRKIRLAFLNILEDTQDAKDWAVEEKNKTMAVINNFTDGLLVIDHENKIELVSPTIEKLFKEKKENILGKSIFKINLKKIKLKPLVEILKKKKEVYRKEIELGEGILLEMTTAYFDFGKKKGILVVLHDVSKDKIIERMKTEFVSIAAHQLRTPLSAIKWSLRMILDGDVGSINEDQKDLLEKTYTSNERMIGLINDLLNVTRIEEGKFLYKPEKMQMEGIVVNVIQDNEDVIKMKNIGVKFEKSKKLLPPVVIDEEKMSLAIHNLLDNALKYTPEKGKIVISLEEKDNEIIFKIKDTGVGIPEDQKERIFTKFFRGSNVIKMETEGSGLGLYTTKNIIDSHKGKIWFESEENKGTTFYFSIPV